jgi:Phasin protein
MSTTQKDKPRGKPRQRNRKADQRGQKPDQQQSPKLVQRDEDRIGAMAASTGTLTNGATAPVEPPSSGAPAPADVPLIDEVAPADAPSIGAAAPVDLPSSEPAPADAPSIGAVTADNGPVSIQTIANAYRDYTKKSLQETGSFVEKLMAVRSFDKAIEVQTEFARQAHANFVAESQKICELYSELAKQIIFRPWIFRPWEGFAAKVTQTGR